MSSLYDHHRLLEHIYARIIVMYFSDFLVLGSDVKRKKCPPKKTFQDNLHHLCLFYMYIKYTCQNPLQKEILIFSTWLLPLNKVLRIYT